MYFEIAGSIRETQIIARGRGVRARKWLNQRYGKHRWRKMKGIASVKLKDGKMHTAEVHWYEAHGLGRREFKIKFPFLD